MACANDFRSGANLSGLCLLALTHFETRVRQSDQLLRGTSGGDHGNWVFFDFIGPLRWFPVATDRIVGLSLKLAPQWGAADAEIKVPSGENTELKRSPFQAWSRSVHSHTCYAYCQGFLPCLFLPFQSIHLHFFQNLSQFFPVLACRIK